MISKLMARNIWPLVRQSAGTTMAFVTWRHVPRGTCHVPPREPFKIVMRRMDVVHSPNGDFLWVGWIFATRRSLFVGGWAL